jgi:four helix bundle protein
MPKFNSYRDLTVWQEAMDLASEIYQITRLFPKHEQYGLTSQVRRSAVSVPSNIAEGHARESTKDFLRHLSIAQGSMAELETQLLLASRLGYVDGTAVIQLLDRLTRTGKMLRGLQKSLHKRLESATSSL